MLKHVVGMKGKFIYLNSVICLQPSVCSDVFVNVFAVMCL